MITLQCKFHALNARYYKYILPLKDFKSFLANYLIKKGLTKNIDSRKKLQVFKPVYKNFPLIACFNGGLNSGWLTKKQPALYKTPVVNNETSFTLLPVAES